MQIRNKRISNDSRKDIVQQLREENVALKKENQRLIQEREADKEIVRISRKTIQDYQELLKEARKLKKDLDNRIQEATRMQQEHKKKFDELIQTMTEQFEAVIKWNIQNCLANGLQPVIYMTSITDDAAEIEAEAHPLKLEK